MADKVSRWLYRFGTKWLAIVSTVLFLAFCAAFLPAQSARSAAYSGTAGTPDTSLFYSPAEIYRMAQVFGAQGRQAYIQARFTFDLAFPLVYTLFLTSGISYLLGHSLDENSAWRKANLLPLSGMLMDYLENVCAARVMAFFPATQPLAAVLAAAATPLKWLFLAASFLLLPVSLILFIRKKTRSSMK